MKAIDLSLTHYYSSLFFYASCTPTCACVEIHVCARVHPLGAAPNFHACVEKKDKSAHAHVGVHEALLLCCMKYYEL